MPPVSSMLISAPFGSPGGPRRVGHERGGIAARRRNGRQGRSLQIRQQLHFAPPIAVGGERPGGLRDDGGQVCRAVGLPQLSERCRRPGRADAGRERLTDGGEEPDSVLGPRGGERRPGVFDERFEQETVSVQPSDARGVVHDQRDVGRLVVAGAPTPQQRPGRRKRECDQEPDAHGEQQ